MHNIVIVSGCKYPNGDAGSVRIHSFAKLLQERGFRTLVIGRGQPVKKTLEVFDEVLYTSFRTGKTLYFQWLSRLFFKKKLKNFLNGITDIYGIMIVDIPFDAFIWLKKYAKTKNIPLVHESVEWYSMQEFSTRIFSHEYIHNEILNLIMVDKSVRVIAISKLLDNFFSEKGCKTVRVPAILDVKSVLASLPSKIRTKTVISYIGLPTKKDRVADLIKGFFQMDKSIRETAELHIVGCIKEQFKELIDYEEKNGINIDEYVKFFGRVSRDTAIEHLKNSDFTMLFRYSQMRYAKAGFPTKVVESMAYGIPVITDFSSDLSEYLIDGENCIKIKGDALTDVANAIKRAVLINSDSYYKMCRAARKTAEEHFDYRVYSKQIDYIFKKD